MANPLRQLKVTKRSPITASLFPRTSTSRAPQIRLTSSACLPLQQTRQLATAASASVTWPKDEKHIVKSILPESELPEISLMEFVFRSCEKWPNLTAIECGLTGRKYTYAQLKDSSVRFGSALRRMGYKRGDVLGMVLPNVPEFPVAFLGAASCGITLTTVNPLYTSEEIARQMSSCEAKGILSIHSLSGTIQEVAKLVPSVRDLIFLGGAVESCVRMEDMLKDSGDMFPSHFEYDLKEDILVLPYSSGTTGLPKGVMLTHSCVVSNIAQLHAPGTTLLSEPYGNYQDVYVAVLPFFHIYGMSACLFSALAQGAKLVTLPRFEAETFLSTITKHKPTILQLVPPLFSFLGMYPNVDITAFERTHTLFCGAAPLGPAAARKVLDRIKKPDLCFQEGFGMTETSPVTHLTPLVGGVIGSCGRPISRTLAKVVDLNTGETLGPHQEGELAVYGPQIMKGYYKNQEATDAMINPAGWLFTGDIAYYDEDNCFFLVDRLKELIKVKGMQVAPSELEDLLRTHPDVMDVAVLGVPDEISGELPRAYVVKRAGSDANEDSIAKFVEAKVAPHKKLRGGVNFVESIPKSNTGKILRRELKAEVLKTG